MAAGQLTVLESKIDALLTDISGLRSDLRVHNAEQRNIEELVKKHEIQLNGSAEKPGGLVSEVKALTKTMSNIERAVWVVVGVILAAVATAILGLL